MLRIPCEYFVDESGLYTCEISLQIIPEENNISLFLGDHVQGKESEDVNQVKFVDSIIPRIPYALETHFKNMVALVMNNCKLEKISKVDLKGFTNLYELDVSNNNLKVLPGDLFFYTKTLQYVSFANNKLEEVDGTLFDRFEDIWSVNFGGNSNFDFPSQVDRENLDDYRKKFKEACEKVKKQKKVGKSVLNDIAAAIKQEKYKDFTIEVENKEFKVHKIVFAARSKLFDELMTNNPESDKLQLQDISAEIFEQILDFIYNDTLPNDDSDFMKILVAASKLKIKKLELFAAEKLVEELKSETESE